MGAVRSYEPCLVSENGSVHPISQKAKSISFWTNIGYEVDSAQWKFLSMGFRLVIVNRALVYLAVFSALT